MLRSLTKNGSCDGNFYCTLSPLFRQVRPKNCGLPGYLTRTDMAIFNCVRQLFLRGLFIIVPQ